MILPDIGGHRLFVFISKGFVTTVCCNGLCRSNPGRYGSWRAPGAGG